MGRGDGLVVIVLAISFDNLSSNPAGYLNFLYEKTKIKQKRGQVLPILKSTNNPWTLTQVSSIELDSPAELSSAF